SKVPLALTVEANTRDETSTPTRATAIRLSNQSERGLAEDVEFFSFPSLRSMSSRLTNASKTQGSAASTWINSRSTQTRNVLVENVMDCLLSMPDLETALSRRRTILNRRMRDVTRHAPRHGGEECLNGIRLALGDQLDFAGGQIADVPGDGMTGRETLRRVAKAHALDVPRINHTLAYDGHRGSFPSASRLVGSVLFPRQAGGYVESPRV